MNLLLKSAKIIAPGNPFHNKTVDIFIKNGIIENIGKNLAPNGKFQEVSLENLHVSSGWFDSSVSFGEPGFEDRETIANGLQAAAKSGFTQVAINPNTNPIVDTNADVTFIKNCANNHAVTVLPVGALTVRSEGVDLAELYDMKNAGAVAFSDYQKPIGNANLLKIALQYAQNFNGLVQSFPQENAVAGKGQVNEEQSSTYLGLKGIPALAEELQIVRDLHILAYTGGKLHIPTISTAGAVSLIKAAKKKGLDVSCSVALHNLYFTDDALASFDTNYKVMPPLRTKKDSKALLKGLEDGTINFVTTDHNPIDVENKNVEFDHAMYGTIGLESAFGVLNKLLGLEKTIEMLTKGAERFLGEAQNIKEGNKANLTLFNPSTSYTFTKANIHSTSKNAIFLGEELQGKAYGIVNNNQLVLN